MGPNEKVLRDAYARYVTGEFESVFDAFADDVVWTTSGDRARVAIAGEWRGLAGVRDYFATMRRDWTLREHNLIELIGQDDRRFAARIAVDARHNRTGKIVRLEKVDLVTMVNGKCTSYSETLDTAMMERAAMD